VEYIEATLDDIALANALAHDVLGRSLDELPPQTRRLLALTDAYVARECERQSIQRTAFRFSRRTLREAIQWGDTQLRVHLERLTELEYVLARREGPGGRFVYELVYDGGGENGKPFVAGLIEIASLRAAQATPATQSPTTTREVAGQTHELAARLRGDSGPVAVGPRPEENTDDSIKTSTYDNSPLKPSRTHSTDGKAYAPSCPHDAVIPAAVATVAATATIAQA
jgi:DNA-binding transcriptional ArsR family regulator